MSKSKDRIKVSFGHNAENVTGSYTLIECGQSGKKILVDFGMIQENTSLLKQYQLNAKKPDFKAKDITYTFLTHAHIDHCGMLGRLYGSNCDAPLIVPEGSSELIKAMLMDSAHIVSRDAEDLTRKLNKNYEPLFTEDDVFTTLSYVSEYPVGQKIRLDDDIEFQLNYNGHIFKSVSITFWIKSGSTVRKIIVTGDIGNLTNKQKYTEQFIPFESCNLLVGECTYADFKRSTTTKDRSKDLEKLQMAVNMVCKDRKGRILIPTFAFGRSPVMLSTLYDLFHEDPNFDIPIIYASPLGTKLMNIFLKGLKEEDSKYLDEVLHWKNLKILSNFEQLKSELSDNKPKIFCLPSGMMTSSYSVYAGTQLLPHSNDCIIFAGFAVEGSLARKIKDQKTKTIMIDGKSIHARCEVINLKSFSSHATAEDLTNIYNSDTAYIDKIALVHGDQNDKIKYSLHLKEELEKKNKTTKVIAVTKSTIITL